MLKNLLACAASTLALASVPATAQSVAAPATSPAAAAWLTQATDIPADPAWRFGTLSNGLRYAVRRGTQPPGAISVRVRVGVGALMEDDRQQGWSHLLEHMVFRGTARYADGEGIKLWQRLGASFGSDTNAQTTQTATTYMLDLPRADAPSYREAMAVLADMMDTARLDPALLATERNVVDAERSSRLSPLGRKLRDAQQPLFFAGTKAATRDVIGTSATLANADTSGLRAYYEAWYRPENAVVVVAGDADPALLEAEVRRAFGGWRGEGKAPPTPDWGAPATPAAPVVTLADPQLPDTLLVGFVSPHAERPVTIARQQEQFAELIAVGILNQRLAAAARRGEAIIGAGVQRVEQRHVENQLLLQVQAKPGQWKAALNQAYAVLNGAVAHPPASAEIDQQAAAIAAALQQQVASASTQTSPALVNSVVRAVEEFDVAAAPAFYATLFAAQRAALTPAAIGDIIKRLLAPAPRLLVGGPQPTEGGTAAAAQALAQAQRVAGGAAAELRSVSLDQLKLPGKSATVASFATIAPLGADVVRFSNGVDLVFKRTAFEKDRVRVRVQVAGGLLGEPRNQPGLWWTAAAVTAGGIGPFAPDELARVIAGRQIGFGVQPAANSIALVGTTNAADLGDALKLMTGAITQPRFDANTVARVRDGTAANYASIYSQPLGVFQVFGQAALHGGDDRFTALPSRDEVAKLSLPDFERFWTERLARGQVRVVIVGDIDRDAAIAAAARTLGTLGVRPGVVMQAADVRATPPSSAAATLLHRGNADQALVVRAFPTVGLLETPANGASLDLAAAILQVRLTEGFRAAEGSTYTPIAAHSQSSELPRYGVLIAGAQVQTGRVDAFGRSLDTAIADLASRGPTPDEFARAQATAVSAAQRSRENNNWWLAVLGSDLSPARVSGLANRVALLRAQTPGTVREVAARYLSPQRGFTVQVRPEPRSAAQ